MNISISRENLIINKGNIDVGAIETSAFLLSTDVIDVVSEALIELNNINGENEE